MAGPGDSGAPIFFNNNTNGLAHIIGMHNASAITSTGSWTGYGEKYSTIAAATHGAIRTF